MEPHAIPKPQPPASSGQRRRQQAGIGQRQDTGGQNEAGPIERCRIPAKAGRDRLGREGRRRDAGLPRLGFCQAGEQSGLRDCVGASS